MTLRLSYATGRNGYAAPMARGASPVVERSGYLADETVFNFIRTEIEEIVTRRRIKAPVYVCHSLGCFVGLDAASREIGSYVIAINMPASPWYGFRHAFGVALRMVRIAATQGIEDAARFRDNWVYFGRPRTDDLAHQRLRQIRQQTNCYTTPRRQDIALFLKSVLLEHRRKGAFEPRVLLLQGDCDRIAPAREADLLCKRLPCCSLVTIDGAHVLPVTHPREVIREIEDFLSAH